LTALSDDSPQVKNLHVVAHVGDGSRQSKEITLLYKVEAGMLSVDELRQAYAINRLGSM
jgi:predicted RecB family endonuclease